ncbi:uncharacterized protein C8Q71DRAFT_720447 [Rhodofomes roseus]|uniref:Uncharacterized protein n=1 Tax=Rhodofomes roseus TaxID=34475 RepID=A0ABQ8KVU6_9APHY|nr:uncharacterized protein C8Q71DRAFT_720447 [Rhodofomes roseus]KAH9843094.1 hypothetical protein C8Q71DRAFT_720447 [Rhodofomes roseus]
MCHVPLSFIGEDIKFHSFILHLSATSCIGDVSLTATNSGQSMHTRFMPEGCEQGQEYQQRAQASEPEPRTKWCRISTHNYVPPSGSVPTGAPAPIAPSPSSIAVQEAVAASSRLETQAPSTSAEPAPQERAAAAAQRKLAAVQAKSIVKKLSVCLLLWTKMSQAGDESTAYKISVEPHAPIMLSAYPHIVDALAPPHLPESLPSVPDTPRAPATDPSSAPCPPVPSPALCVEVFDPALSRWVVTAVSDSLGVDLGSRKAEVLLRAWAPNRKLTNVDCPGLAGHLERLYGIRCSTDGSYERKRAASPPAATSSSKRIRLASDPLPIAPMNTRSPARRATTYSGHAASSPGPILHDTGRSLLRFHQPNNPQPIPSSFYLSLNDLPTIDEESDHEGTPSTTSASIEQDGPASLASVAMDSGDASVLFPSRYYFADIYHGAKRIDELHTTSGLSVRDAFAEVFPKARYAESTWTAAKRVLRKATEAECAEWLAKGKTASTLFTNFRSIVQARQHERPLPRSARRGQTLPPSTPGSPMVVLGNVPTVESHGLFAPLGERSTSVDVQQGEPQSSHRQPAETASLQVGEHAPANTNLPVDATLPTIGTNPSLPAIDTSLPATDTSLPAADTNLPGDANMWDDFAKWQMLTNLQAGTTFLADSPIEDQIFGAQASQQVVPAALSQPGAPYYSFPIDPGFRFDPLPSSSVIDPRLTEAADAELAHYVQSGATTGDSELFDTIP